MQQKEELLRQKNKKKVSFQKKNIESDEYGHSELPENVSAEKEKEENPEGDQVDSHLPSVPHVGKT